MFATDHHINALRIVRELAGSVGIEVPDELWEEFSFDLDSENVAFNMHQQLTFHRRLIQLMDDPLLGLKLAPLFPSQAYGMFGFAIMCAPNLREGLRIADRFDRLTLTLLNLSFHEEAREGRLVFSSAGLNIGPTLHTFFADRDIGSTQTGTGNFISADTAYTQITFEHGDQGQPQAYEQYFSCPVEFNSSSNSIAIAAEALDRPNPYRDTAAFETCIRECERQVSGLAGSSDIVGMVRDELFLRPGYLQDIESIAGQLSTSPRTLRRRLEEEGTSFIDLQQDIRFQQAREHLRNRKLSIAEISDILGYSEPANFSTAFKRWTGGVSPRQFRQSEVA